MLSMTASRSYLPLEVILAWLGCGLENHTTRKMESMLDTMNYSGSRANISATSPDSYQDGFLCID